MRKVGLLAILTAVCLSFLVARMTAPSHAAEGQTQSRLCVVWSSGDPGVAKNVCFMYTHNAKRRAWFDDVYLVVWGPSARLLTENEDLQNEIRAMEKTGVVVEACVACAQNYGVVDNLKKLGIDVKPMGQPLTERLKGPWKVLTF